MKLLAKAVAISAFAALAACGGQGDDTMGDNVADAYENKADSMDAMADNAATDATAESMGEQADALRDVGEAKEEAIDEADVNAQGMSPAQQNQVANTM